MSQTKQALSPEAMAILLGLGTGLPTGRSMAGATAAEVAPYGKMTRAEELARKAALIGAPLGGVAGLVLAKKHGLTPRMAEFVRKLFPQGVVNPSVDRELIEYAAPFLSTVGGSAAGGAATGAMTGAAAHLLPNPTQRAGESTKTGSANLENSLGVLWSLYGEPTGHEKTAAVTYFYGLRKHDLDQEALGQHFCKVASELHVDPWALAWSVKENLPAYKVLAKTASDQKTRRLASYYVGWADSIEKKAIVGAIGKGIKAFGGRAAQGAKNLATKAKGMFSHGAPTPAAAPKAAPYVDPAFPKLPTALQKAPSGPVAAAKPMPAPQPAPVQAAPAAPVKVTNNVRPLPESGGPVAGDIPKTRDAWRRQNVVERQAQQQRMTATPKPGAQQRAAAQRQASAAKTEPTRTMPRDAAEQKALKKTLLDRQAARYQQPGMTRQQGAAAAATQRKGIQQQAKAGPGAATFGHKLLGGAALAGGVGVPAAMMMGGGEQQEPQYGYPQGYPQ